MLINTNTIKTNTVNTSNTNTLNTINTRSIPILNTEYWCWCMPTDNTCQKSRPLPFLPAILASQKVASQQTICQNAIQLKNKYILKLDADIILPLVLILRLLSLARETMLRASTTTE